MPESPDAKSRPADVYRRLLGYCAAYWHVFAIAAVAMGINALTDIGFAYMMQNLGETLAPGELTPEKEAIRRWLPIAITLLFIIRGASVFASTYLLGWMGRRVILMLRGELFGKFLVLPTGFFDATTASELLSKLTYNIEQIADAASRAVTIVVRDTVRIFGLVIYMVYISPLLSAVIFVVGPLIAMLIRFLSKMFRRHSARIQDSMGDVTKITSEALQSHRIIKIFGGQHYESQRFDVVNDKNSRLNMRLIAARGAGDALTSLVLAIGVASVVYFATLESVRPAGIGDFLGFITAMVLLMQPLRQVTNINVALQRGIAAGSSVFRLLDEEPETDTGTLAPDTVEGRVEYRDVSFTYSDEKGRVLEHVNLEVPAGQTLAIVGRSGSGKSTLVSLLPRFYEPDSGSILLDGRPLQEYSLTGLRAQISLVSQEVVLFNDTIANNIAYGGLEGASRSEIERAAHAAHVNEFVDQMPAGLDTTVGDRGVLLSGGQRQRIAIARALLKNAPILILDEATSALDTESERHIQQALQELMQNRTTLVIAHRLSTVENADRIIVMEAGRIIETGNHGDLLAAGGHYANLYRMQFRDEPGPGATVVSR